MAVIDIDGSEQYYDRASSEIRSGNLKKAEESLNKAIKLYPSNSKAKTLLEQLQAGKFSNGTSENSSSNEGGTRKRPTTAPSKPAEPKLGEDFTQDQLEMVTKLKK